jgi:hypothetical protein
MVLGLNSLGHFFKGLGVLLAAGSFAFLIYFVMMFFGYLPNYLPEVTVVQVDYKVELSREHAECLLANVSEVARTRNGIIFSAYAIYKQAEKDYGGDLCAVFYGYHFLFPPDQESRRLTVKPRSVRVILSKGKVGGPARSRQLNVGKILKEIEKNKLLYMELPQKAQALLKCSVRADRSSWWIFRNNWLSNLVGIKPLANLDSLQQWSTDSWTPYGDSTFFVRCK